MAFSLYAGGAFWVARDQAFAGKLSSDNAVSIWFYDHVSRELAAGTWPTWLSDFNHPRPYARIKEFPAVMDAVLAAPLGWLLDFPHQWNATLGLAVLVNGLGTALLARGAGARGVGLLVAGCLGALCRPVWKDMVMARMNAVWLGIPAAAVGASLLAARVEGKGLGAMLGRAPVAVLAGALGALAATVYPPGLLLFAPAAALLLVGPLWEGRGRGLVPLGLAVGVGLLLAGPELQEILASRQGTGDLAPEGCPDRYGALVAEALWQTTPDAFQGLSLPGTALYGWVLAPLALLHRRRGAALLVGLVGALWALLSLGPCAAVREGVPLDLSHWPVLGGILPPLWKAGAPLHDFGRFASVAVLLAAALGGLGLDALAGEKGGPRRLLALAAGAAVVAQVQWYVVSESLSPGKWHPAQTPAVAAWLLDQPAAARFPVAELPFDRRVQFLSAIAAPGPRLNPLRPGDPPPREDAFTRWLMALGRGQPLPEAPTPADVRNSGLRHVFYDAGRCRGGGVPAAACGPEVQAALVAVLGEPALIAGGAWVWSP